MLKSQLYLAGLAIFGLCISGCAEPTRTKISAAPLATKAEPQTVFGDVTLKSNSNPQADLELPVPPERALTLNECIAIAKRVSPNLDSADQNQISAQWSRWQAVTNFLPTASTSYQVTKYNDLAQSGHSSLVGQVPGIGGTTRYLWQAQLQQPIFTGGRNSANYILANLGVAAADIQKTQAQEDLLLSVKQSYYSILAVEKALEVAKTSVINLRSHRDVAQNFFDVGMVPKNQVLEAEVELARAVQEETALARDLTVAKARLNILLRQPVSEPVKVVDTLAYTPFPLTMDQCLETGMVDSPEIRLGRNYVEAAAKGIDLAKSSYYPEVNMVATHSSVGNTARAHGGWSTNDSGWEVATVASFNFWEWGRTKADVEKSRVSLNRSLNDLVSLEDNSKLEITTNYQTLLSAGKNIEVSAQAVVAATEDLRMVTERYLEQVATNTEVLDAQTRFSQANYDHYQALYNYNLAWATLERSLGRQVLPKGLAPLVNNYRPNA